MTTNKIQKTNRILLKHTVIYCSCEIVRDVKEFVIRVNQKLAPKKGELEPLIERLRILIKTKPDHFPHSSRILIAGRSNFNGL